MDTESFNALALRVIAREAGEQDRRALETEMTSVPSRRDEFEQLKRTHAILQTVAPVTQAMRTSSPELPAHRVNELRTAVRQHFGPAAQRAPANADFQIWPHVLRWVFGGGGLAALGFAIVMFCFANRTIEIGLYGTDLARDGEKPLTAEDMPGAQLMAFAQDPPFDQWQSQPLAWNERAKIWVDNERDLLYVMHRVRHGQIITETQPLAPDNAAQREQIRHLVESLKN